MLDVLELFNSFFLTLYVLFKKRGSLIKYLRVMKKLIIYISDKSFQSTQSKGNRGC